MAFPTSVNDQITDSITQVNVKILGDAPAMSMGNLLQVTAQALSNAAHNATTGQQQTNLAGQAATTMGVTTLYSIDTASTGVATQQINELSKTKDHDALFMENISLSKKDVKNLTKMKHLKYLHLKNVIIKDKQLDTLTKGLKKTEIYREGKL